MLHLDIETFYLFAKILLDRIADTLGLVFGVKWKRSGSSYSDLSIRFTALCGQKGLEILPDDLPALISKLWAIVDYRNKLIKHPGDSPVGRGTLFAPGEASSIVASRMYPTEEDAENLRSLSFKGLAEFAQDLHWYCRQRRVGFLVSRATHVPHTMRSEPSSL